MAKQGKPFKWALLKKKNKRIHIIVYTCDDNSLAIVITTKALNGDWRKRDIRETDVVYGVETFDVLHSIFTMLFNDWEFKKAINPLFGHREEDKFSCATNIKSNQ